MKRRWIVLEAAGVVCLSGLLLFLFWPRSAPFRDDKKLQASLNGIVDSYRKIIVLMDGAESLDEATRARCAVAGRKLFWRKQQAIEEVSRRLGDDYRAAAAAGFKRNTDGIQQLLHLLYLLNSCWL